MRRERDGLEPIYNVTIAHKRLPKLPNTRLSKGAIK